MNKNMNEQEGGVKTSDDLMPLVYDEAEMDAIETYITKNFGEHQNVLHEIVSPDLHIDLVIVEPTAERDFYTIVTMGAGAYQMEVPEGYNGPDRVEILFNLPKDWKINSSDEKDYWPLRWLKVLARLSMNYNTWLGWGHTVPAGEPFAENTMLSGVMLTEPYCVQDDTAFCKLPNGDQVAFWQVMPIYEEEMQYKLRNGAESLIEAFGDAFPHVLDISRPCVVAEKPQKEFALAPEQIQELFDWEFPLGCLATDRILVDGMKVGYMYREEPDADKVDYDSGWRFLAGDEDEEYIGNPENSGVYSLNTVANYDPDIISLLRSAYNTAFIRDEDGGWIEEEC